jgi:hypothetical protein
MSLIADQGQHKLVRIPPDTGKLDVAYRSAGYTFNTAIADLIDNSVDAGAKKIKIRFIIDENKYLSLAILDDGHGMNADGLLNAMRFGSSSTQNKRRLGKFGLGLKVASLSQARSLLVFTSNDGRHIYGMGWGEDGVKRDYMAQLFSEDHSRNALQHCFPDSIPKKTWTMLLLEKLYRIGEKIENPEKVAEDLMEDLSKHLGLTFHRFIKNPERRLSIQIENMNFLSKDTGISLPVLALDPFGYRESPDKNFPSEMLLKGASSDIFKIRAHIWPPRSNDANYRLPGGPIEAQGFYFYRNDRLIQAGGWNGCYTTDSHLSLARVEVDTNPEHDFELSLNFNKTTFVLRAEDVEAIQQGETASGVSFSKYVQRANEIGRPSETDSRFLPTLPTTGIPAAVVAVLQKEFKSAGFPQTRELSFEWIEPDGKKLEEEDIFDVDLFEKIIYLNKRYRTDLLKGARGSQADIPFLKVLLFFGLEKLLRSGKCSAKENQRKIIMNRALKSALQHERH